MDKIDEIFERYDINEYVPSIEYTEFRKNIWRNRNFYEKACKFAEFLNIGPDKKSLEKLKESIRVTHLDVKPVGVVSLGVLVLLFFIFLGLFSGFLTAIFNASTGSFIQKVNFLIVALWLIVGVVSYVYVSNYPNYSANKWRLKAGNQMVLCILYIMMYMRHTSNLEHAVRFAAEHVGEPLNLDLMKVLWDVETGRYSNVAESLDNYLRVWKDEENFVESFHLIEGSLYEVEEEGRLKMLDRALDVMVNGTYEKMLHFAHDLKNPITMLHMLGVVLPILGLVIFPLVGSFMGGLIRWYHLAVLYNIFLPIFVLWLGNSILSKRPTGYGERELEGGFKIDVGNALLIGGFLGVLILLIGLSPIILHYLYPDNLFLNGLLDYKCRGDVCTGPLGLVPLILSLFLPLSLAFGLGSYYKLKTKDIIKIRENTKRLEREFASSLFQLGNRIEDGLPVELAVGKVAGDKEGTETGKFFKNVDTNLRFGMGIERAIFDKERGAILGFPSPLISSSMRVMIETARKGYGVVSRALISISEYAKSIRQVEERLKDLLSDVVTSMKGQIGFLTPVIAGIVVAIASLISSVIGRLSELGTEGFEGEIPVIGTSLEGLPFDVQNVIPPYFFQLVVGLYVVQVIIILTVLSEKIESGDDRLSVEYGLGKNLFRSTMLYCLVSLIGVLVFKGFASMILRGG